MSIKKSFLLLGLSLLPTMLLANLVQNGSFELAPTSGSEVAKHWGKINGVTRENCSPNCADNFDYLSRLIVDGTSPDIRPVIYTPINLTSAGPLDLTFSYAALPAAGQHAQIRIFLVEDPNGGLPLPSSNISNYNHQAVYTSPVVTNTSWQQTTITINPAGNYDYLWIELNYTSGISFDNMVDFDAFVLSDPNYQQNLCLQSFAPFEESSYVVSGWAREDNPIGKTTFTDPAIELVFEDAGNAVIGTAGPFTPSGAVIDEWQRIEAVFTIPTNTTFLSLRLKSTNSQGDVVFFDDIRVFPVDGNMVSYVYDPISQRLVAELDANNYATLYEYDEEGKLIRTKKETERGKMTVTETRENQYNPN